MKLPAIWRTELLNLLNKINLSKDKEQDSLNIDLVLLKLIKVTNLTKLNLPKSPN